MGFTIDGGILRRVMNDGLISNTELIGKTGLPAATLSAMRASTRGRDFRIGNIKRLLDGLGVTPREALESGLLVTTLDKA